MRVHLVSFQFVDVGVHTPDLKGDYFTKRELVQTIMGMQTAGLRVQHVQIATHKPKSGKDKRNGKLQG